MKRATIAISLAAFVGFAPWAHGAFAGASAYVVEAADATAGGGVVTGGIYSATVSIASVESPSTIAGGPYEATGGLERRRFDTRADAVFSDGFE